MNLVIDIGNSNIVFGVYENKELLSSLRLITDLKKTADEYQMLLKNELQYNIDNCLISSVVPEINDQMIEFIVNSFKITPLILGSGIKTGIKINIENPKELGADLLAGIVGANSLYNQPLVVIDLGTATKLTYCKNNQIEGVIIAPGVKTSLNSLVNNTSLLTQVHLEVPTNVLGKNSIKSIQSGILLGQIMMIEGFIDLIEKEYGKTFFVLTGGISTLLKEHISRIDVYNEFVVIYGLNEILEKNSKK